MRLIDADALMDKMRKAFCIKASGEILVNIDDVLNVIEEMPPVALPQRIEWDDSSTGKDEYHRGYMAGWNMYLATVEGLIVQAKEAKQ